MIDIQYSIHDIGTFDIQCVHINVDARSKTVSDYNCLILNLLICRSTWSVFNVKILIFTVFRYCQQPLLSLGEGPDHTLHELLVLLFFKHNLSLQFRDPGLCRRVSSGVHSHRLVPQGRDGVLVATRLRLQPSDLARQCNRESRQTVSALGSHDL